MDINIQIFNRITEKTGLKETPSNQIEIRIVDVRTGEIWSKLRSRKWFLNGVFGREIKIREFKDINIKEVGFYNI